MEYVTAAVIAPILLAGGVPIFIYLYAILRWRAGSSEEPGLGSYALVLAFRLMAGLLMVGTFSMMLYLWFSAEWREENKRDALRLCWALLVSGGLFLGLQAAFGNALRPAGAYRAARRLFGGGLVGVSGIVTFAALTLFMVALFQDVSERRADQRADMMKAFGCWLFCFGILYVVASILMAMSAQRTPSRPPDS